MSEAPIANEEYTLSLKRHKNWLRINICFHHYLLCFLFFPVISLYWSARSECPTDVRGRRPVPGDRAFNSHYRWDTCLFCPLTLSSVGQSRNRWFLLARFGREEGAEQGWATTFGTVGSQALGFSNCKQTHHTPCPYPFPILSPGLPATLERTILNIIYVSRFACDILVSFL